MSPAGEQLIRVAGCILRDTEGRMLLLHRKTAKFTHWELPGGKLEAGEEPAEAATREIAEELAVQPYDLVKVGKAIVRDKYNQPFEFTWFTAACPKHQQPRIAEPQTFDDLRYFSLTELLVRNDLSANMQALLSQIQAKQVTIT